MEDVNIAEIERRLARAAGAARDRNVERDQAMRELARLGVTLERIGDIAGLTKGRVSQVVSTKNRSDNQLRQQKPQNMNQVADNRDV